MARGGFRPGSGRKKGKKDRKFIEKPESIVFLSKAEEFAVFYRGVLSRATQGKKPTEAEKQQMNKLAAELTKTYESSGDGEDRKIEDLLPLDYMLQVMNNQSVDQDTRLKAASLAAPYIHPRKEGAGKKEEKEDKAKKAAIGKFAVGAAPLKLVK